MAQLVGCARSCAYVVPLWCGTTWPTQPAKGIVIIVCTEIALRVASSDYGVSLWNAQTDVWLEKTP
jgi:hypothetical protein